MCLVASCMVSILATYMSTHWWTYGTWVSRHTVFSISHMTQNPHSLPHPGPWRFPVTIQYSWWQSSQPTQLPVIPILQCTLFGCLPSPPFRTSSRMMWSFFCNWTEDHFVLVVKDEAEVACRVMWPDALEIGPQHQLSPLVFLVNNKVTIWSTGEIIATLW